MRLTVSGLLSTNSNEPNEVGASENWWLGASYDVIHPIVFHGRFEIGQSSCGSASWVPVRRKSDRGRPGSRGLPSGLYRDKTSDRGCSELMGIAGRCSGGSSPSGGQNVSRQGSNCPSTTPVLEAWPGPHLLDSTGYTGRRPRLVIRGPHRLPTPPEFWLPPISASKGAGRAGYTITAKLLEGPRPRQQ